MSVTPRRTSRAERDEKIVAEAGPWTAVDLRKNTYGFSCGVAAVMPRDSDVEDNAADAASRILNRIGKLAVARTVMTHQFGLLTHQKLTREFNAWQRQWSKLHGRYPTALDVWVYFEWDTVLDELPRIARGLALDREKMDERAALAIRIATLLDEYIESDGDHWMTSGDDLDLAYREWRRRRLRAGAGGE